MQRPRVHGAYAGAAVMNYCPVVVIESIFYLLLCIKIQYVNKPILDIVLHAAVCRINNPNNLIPITYLPCEVRLRDE